MITGVQREKGDTEMAEEISLSVNEVPISLNEFVQGFIEHTFRGMLAALDGTEKMKTLDVTIDGNEVVLNLNGSRVPMNPFVTGIIRNTTAGMLSSLRKVDRVDRAKLNIRA